jgi:hypothetical protein
LIPAVGKSDRKNAQLRIGNQQGGNKRCVLCGADKSEFTSYHACRDAVEKTLSKLLLAANGLLNLPGIESAPPILRGALSNLDARNLKHLLPAALDNLHICTIIKKVSTMVR